MDYTSIIAQVLTVALTCFVARNIPTSMVGEPTPLLSHPVLVWVPGLLAVAPFLVAVFVPMPLLVFYALIWLAYAAATVLAQQPGSRSCLLTNLAAIVMILPHVIASSALALVTDVTLWAVSSDTVLRCITICFSLLASYASGKTMRENLVHKDPDSAAFEKSLRPLTWFSWFALAYLAFDALSNDLKPEANPISLFTLMSALLLGIGLIAFLSSAARLGHDAYLEEEYLRLEEERKAEEARMRELRKQAYSDALTGLHSRRTALETIQTLIDGRQRFCVAFIDMNDLKMINDTFGHSRGDACLMRLANALNEAFGSSASICRMGGDEFLAIFETADAAEVERRAAYALSLIREQTEETPALSFCYGILTSEGNVDSSPAELIQRADLIMYEYKKEYHRQHEQGGNMDSPSSPVPEAAGGDGNSARRINPGQGA